VSKNKILKLTKIFVVLVVFSSFFLISFGQEKPKPILFEELTDEYCSEMLSVHFDHFIIKLNELPNSKGYIVFHGKNSLEGKNLLYFEIIQKYLVGFRGFEASRIATIRGENKDKMIMHLWIVPSGAESPTVAKNFVEEKIDSTTLFDKGWADWYKWNDSEWTIYSYSFVEWGCEMDVNIEAFAENLRTQSNLTGYLVVYTKFGKGKNQAKKVTDFAIKELTRQHKIPKERIKTIYGGNRNKPELELWLVSNGSNPPTLKPEKIK